MNAIPAIWLIGPDGKVVAKDLHGKAIYGAVSQALGRGEASKKGGMDEETE